MRQTEAYFLPVLNLQGHGPDQLAVNCSTGRWEGTGWVQTSTEPGCWKLSGQKKSPDRDKGVFRWHNTSLRDDLSLYPLSQGYGASAQNVWYTEARLLCSWPKSSLKQQAHFTNTATKTCILKNKVIFHWCPALPTAPFKWPAPNDSLWYDLAYLKRGTRQQNSTLGSCVSTHHSWDLPLTPVTCAGLLLWKWKRPGLPGPALWWPKALRLLQFPCS